MTTISLSSGRHIYYKLTEALKNSEKHRAAFVTFSATFPEEVVTEWKRMVALWQEDKDAADPFDEPTLGTSNLENPLALSY